MSSKDRANPFDVIADRTVVPALKMHRMVLGDDGTDLFAASVADMDFAVPEPVLAALQKRLDHGIFGYETVPDGLLPALVGWLETRHGWRVEQNHILRSPNILNALALAVSLFTDEGDGVIVQPPVFFDFFDVVRENHRSLVFNPLILEDGHYRMDFEDLERKAAEPHTRLLLLCNPHNPVARVWSVEELRALGDICERHGVLVVADEMHGDLVFPCSTYIPFASLGRSYAANCVTCLSPAKTFNIASCCSAFTVISDDDRRKAYQAESSRLTVNKNNAFANAAMEAAFTDGAPWLHDALAYIKDNVALVRSHLRDIPEVELIEPEGTFLLWLDFRALGLDPDGLTEFLRRGARWAVTRGQAFGEEGRGFARLNVACPRSKLDAALGQLRCAVESRERR